MNQFLSCDWGTTNFRLRLVNVSDFTILAEEKNEDGIAATYKMWQAQNEQSRWEFYASKINERIQSLSTKVQQSLEGVPVILSGMASSSIGMIELPYKKLPFHLDGSDLIVEAIKPGNYSNGFIIVSGARTDDDVMRGEETKVLGYAALGAAGNLRKKVILPGTHTKHIIIEGNKVVSFSTYMTGEFFQLLSTHSILSTSLQEGGRFDDKASRESFCNGVQRSRESNFLHAVFLTRTNELLKNMAKEQNYFYLSGLLIGSELQAIEAGDSVHLVGSSAISSQYAEACNILGINIASKMDGDLALARGQQAIFDRHYGTPAI